MPDVFERYFGAFGYQVSDLYDLVRLDPSYRVVWPEQEAWDIPAGTRALRAFFESHERGAGAQLERFLADAGSIYDAAMGDYLFRPSLTLGEFVDVRLVREVVRLRMLESMSKHARRFFKNPHLARLVEWPVLFLGASAADTSAMYSLMSYADMSLGTWYPMGGMHQVIQAMERVAKAQGVEIRYGQRVEQIEVNRGRVTGVSTSTETVAAEAVLAAADYHHVEQHLLPQKHRQYSQRYWKRRVMSPSSLLFYLGIEANVDTIPHHTLFFDEDLDAHMADVYSEPVWPKAPLFYVCTPSVTDPIVAPKGQSNLFILIPLAPGLDDSETMRERLYDVVMKRLERHTGLPLRDRVRAKRSYAMRDFVNDYSAFKGNAYGMANTLMQTGPMKPKLKSTRVNGLYFAGQLTVPGPGMPPSLISGELSASLLSSDLENNARRSRLTRAAP
jgi:phytoene desaturase